MEQLALHHLLPPRTGCLSMPAAAAATVPSLNSRRSLSGTLKQAHRRPRRVSSLSAVSTKDAPSSAPSSALSSVPAPDEEEGAFDWLDQRYPFAPVCDLDPGKPHGKTYGDGAQRGGLAGTTAAPASGACSTTPARTASRRIDDRGRLQCVYHGWCFDGAGACKFIPQAPALGPPVHESSRACVASYPCVVQNRVLWFYPRTEAEHRDVLRRKRPPYIKEIADPSSFVTAYGVRDLCYGYDVLIENEPDGPFSYPICTQGPEQPTVETRRSWESSTTEKAAARPIKMKIEEASKHGFLASRERGQWNFVAPCTFHSTGLSLEPKKEPQFLLVVPVGPGRSRLIWAFPRNFWVWLDMIVPRWVYHIRDNSVLDSDSYILHVEERKFVAMGLENWQSRCYVPTSADAFRSWFRKHSKNQVGWATPQPGGLPPADTRERIMQRYWSHVAQCASCSAALRAMRALEVTLQVASVAVVGFLAVAKGTLVTSIVQKAAVGFHC